MSDRVEESAELFREGIGYDPRKPQGDPDLNWRANEAMGQFVRSRDEIRKQRSAEGEGYWFPLKMTGGFAQVKAWSIADRAMFARLPNEVQALLADELDRVGSGKKKETLSSRERIEKITKSLQDQEDLADWFVHIGFIAPRVVRNESEIDERDPFCICAADLHLEEKLEYMSLILDGEVAAAKKLRPFRSGPNAPVFDQSGDQEANPSE